MDDITDPVSILEAPECWERLRTEQLGRLVTRVGDVIDIFPINYVVDGESIVVRTAEGNKLAELVISSEVLFEVDHHTDTEAWSVVVRGVARRLDTEAEIRGAEELPLQPWLPTLKRNFVRISATSISGRSFVFGPEPERDGVQPY